MNLSTLILLIYVIYVKACSIFLGLISMCEVMKLHKYIELVGLGWDYEQSFMMLYEMKSKYMLLTISQIAGIDNVDLHVVFGEVLYEFSTLC